MAPDSRTTAEGAVGPQTFRSITAIIVWWVWVLFAVANLIDLAVQGRDHLAVLAAAILLMVTGIAYVTAERPRVIAADDGITVRNPLRDHHIPWTLVSKVDVADLLRVHHRRPGNDRDNGKDNGSDKDKVITAWAVHYSRRRQLTSDMRARRAATARGNRGRSSGGGLFGIPDPGYAARSARPPGSSPEAIAQRIVRLLNDRAAASQREPADPTATQDPAERTERVVSTWSWPAVAALAVPALALLVVVLV